MPQKELKIGLALGGAGAKGAAHIGILRVFEKYGIKISSIIGTSAGAVVGAAYALGLSPDEILKRSESFNKKNFLRIGNFHLFGESLIKPKDADKLIKKLVNDDDFDKLKIPFKAVAVNLESGKEILISDGKLWEALRASSAIPGIFSPFFLKDQYLVDGGLLNNVPVNHLRKQNDVDVVIGVELGNFTEKQYLAGIVWERYYHKPKDFHLSRGYFATLKINATLVIHILLRTIDLLRAEAQASRYQEAHADLMIRPKLNDISLLQFRKYEQALKAGEDAAEAVMPELLEIIKKKQEILDSQNPGGDAGN